MRECTTDDDCIEDALVPLVCVTIGFEGETLDEGMDICAQPEFCGLNVGDVSPDNGAILTLWYDCSAIKLMATVTTFAATVYSM